MPTDEGNFYSPPPPTSGDKNEEKYKVVLSLLEVTESVSIHLGPRSIFMPLAIKQRFLSPKIPNYNRLCIN